MPDSRRWHHAWVGSKSMPVTRTNIITARKATPFRLRMTAVGETKPLHPGRAVPRTPGSSIMPTISAPPPVAPSGR